MCLFLSLGTSTCFLNSFLFLLSMAVDTVCSTHSPRVGIKEGIEQGYTKGTELGSQKHGELQNTHHLHEYCDKARGKLLVRQGVTEECTNRHEVSQVGTNGSFGIMHIEMVKSSTKEACQMGE